MLHIYYGPAGAGKTSLLMQTLGAQVQRRAGGNLLVVPEQYSHEAERELCRICGDSASLYAEVLSFTGLARKVADELGGSAAPLLDQGGRLLCMARALGQIAPRLKLYGSAARRAQTQQSLLQAVDELKLACASPEQLLETADQCDGYLGDKLRDLALVLASYDAVAAQSGADPSDRLTRLAEQIPESSPPRSRFYLDGFTDFTRQELAVLEALLEQGAEIALYLTLDSPEGGSELYGAQRSTVAELKQRCTDHGVAVELHHLEAKESHRAPALQALSEALFGFTAEKQPDPEQRITLHRAQSIAEECEFAAAKALELARNGCRWRDIAVAVRGFGDYLEPLQRMFEHYGVPLYAAQRTDLLQKPLGVLISAAYDVITGGWDSEDVLAVLRTGLTALTPEDCDTLENYAILWGIRGGMWKRSEPWSLHPEGYGKEYTDAAKAEIQRIDGLRRTAAEPLAVLERESKNAATAEGQAKALAAFFDALGLARRLEERSDALRADGREALAAEYAQIWDLLVSALEQAAAVLGDTELSTEDFAKLFTLMLSRYDIGTIPVSLDRVTAGDYDRMRRRGLKHLIVLGASDDRVPSAGDPGGVFSVDDRRRLLELELDIGGGREDDLWREYALSASCLALPEETLTVCWSALDAEGQPLRPAYFVERIRQMFGPETEAVDLTALRQNAAAPALSLAARYLRGVEDERCRAAFDWFQQRAPEKLRQFERRAHLLREDLTPERAAALYGSQTRLSATRSEQYARCRYAYFLKFGLKAQPRRSSAFSAAEIGTFFHAILQGVAADAAAMGGFQQITDEELRACTRRRVEEYIHVEMQDFQDKSPRFVYLFQRLTGSVETIVLEMAQELRCSDFAPLDFELDFSDREALPPVTLSDGETRLTVTGIADRVDGWVHDGKLYLRVVDYKTGRKVFSLSDVLYGMDLQMLLYLFALGKVGAERYGRQVIPAGVLYHPARDPVLSASERMPEAELQKKRASELRRSGLVLESDGVPDAMDNEPEKRYVKVRSARGAAGKGVALASAERMGLLARHIEDTLLTLARELRRGSIQPQPIYRSAEDTACTYCDYKSVCRFEPGVGGDCHRIITPLTPDEVWAKLEGGEGDG